MDDGSALPELLAQELVLDRGLVEGAGRRRRSLPRVQVSKPDTVRPDADHLLTRKWQSRP
ncbi:hypothetical protein [Streptomyces sp. NPDC002265]|uniref:hypothetical protein n=1 Tax=Streptomyces sp. NPDC002265 TaxID=3154415 RepID=UPI0033327AFC